MHYTIKCIKVDCLLRDINKDLCLGGVARSFKLDGRKRCIYYKHLTIKYTSSLALQAFITGNFSKILRTLPNIVNSIRRKFNFYKQTPVLEFASISINNIHTVGRFKTKDLSWIDSKHLPPSFSFCASSHVQEYLLVPFVGSLPKCAQVVSLNKNPGGLVKINLTTGYFTFICKSVEDFITIHSLLQELTDNKDPTL